MNTNIRTGLKSAAANALVRKRGVLMDRCAHATDPGERTVRARQATNGSAIEAVEPPDKAMRHPISSVDVPIVYVERPT